MSEYNNGLFFGLFLGLVLGFAVFVSYDNYLKGICETQLTKDNAPRNLACVVSATVVNRLDNKGG